MPIEPFFFISNSQSFLIQLYSLILQCILTKTAQSNTYTSFIYYIRGPVKILRNPYKFVRIT